MTRRRGNPFDRTTWAEAELVANDALEERDLGAAEQVIGQVSNDEIADMLVKLVNETTPAQYPARRIGDPDLLATSPARLEQAKKAWWRVHVEGPAKAYGNFPKLSQILVQELRRKIDDRPVLHHMFEDVERSHAHWDGSGFDVIFVPRRWLRYQRTLAPVRSDEERGIPVIRPNPAADGGGSGPSSSRGLPRVPRIHGVIDRLRVPRGREPPPSTDALAEAHVKYPLVKDLLPPASRMVANPVAYKPSTAGRAKELLGTGNPAVDEDTAARAVQKYAEFHRFDPKRLETIDCPMPTSLVKIGKATWVAYRSNKTDPDTGKRPRSPIDYIHEHDAGVHLYMPADQVDGGDSESAPSWLAETVALVKLGTCLGFGFVDEGEHQEAESFAPMPELWSTPDGKCLLVIQSRREVISLMYGGGLGVEARGIVG